MLKLILWPIVGIVYLVGASSIFAADGGSPVQSPALADKIEVDFSPKLLDPDGDAFQTCKPHSKQGPNGACRELSDETLGLLVARVLAVPVPNTPYDEIKRRADLGKVVEHADKVQLTRSEFELIKERVGAVATAGQLNNYETTAAMELLDSFAPKKP